MKVVLDTNVVMSGIFFGGIPGQILRAWGGGAFELVLSADILEEYRDVADELAGDHSQLEDAWVPVLALLPRNATLVQAPPLKQQVGADPDDDKFLAAARAAGASIVVSGDKHLKAVSGWNGIEVLSPRGFRDRLGAE